MENEFDKFILMKNCPFCGGEKPEVMKNKMPAFRSDIEFYAVECKDCWAHGPAAFTEYIAILLWNGAKDGK